MSRKYMNDRWCVRCSREGPTPYLRDKLHLLTQVLRAPGIDVAKLGFIDLGCGSGRNTKWLASEGYSNAVAFDMAGDYGHKIMLGQERLPLLTESVDVVLANYVFMFLSMTERLQVIREICRVAKPNCRVMVELYPAKDSEAPTEEALQGLQNELISAFKARRWAVMHEVQGKFIMRKP